MLIFTVFLKTKEDMLLEAYIRENGAIFDLILRSIDEAHNLPVSFDEKSKFSFSLAWDGFLSDYDRIIYCVSYFHSNYFKNAEEYHNKQLKDLEVRLLPFFKDEDTFVHTMYAMCSILYDSAYSVASNRVANTEDYKNRVFETEQAILRSGLIMT